MARARADGEEKPDLVIGVDFGMTYTGVAFSNLIMPAPHAIQVWPGEEMRVNKVPTLLLYEAQHAGHNQDVKEGDFRAWGYQCGEVTREDVRTVFIQRRNFKTLLGDPDSGYSPEEVKKWFRDYLRQIYLHIIKSVEKHLSIRMSSAKVEFVFSLPTTWSAPSMVNDFRQVIIDAGFERGGDGHKVSIGLTEAQAAAVYASKSSMKTFNDGDVLLICDSGGGTTDLCLLEMKINKANVPVSFNELAPAAGEGVGSTDIDTNFEILVKSRLNSDPNISGLLAKNQHSSDSKLRAFTHVDQVAEQMVSSKAFQKLKCLFGTPESKMTRQIDCPGLPTDYQNQAIGVEDGMMRITKEDVHKLFHQNLNNEDEHNQDGPVPTIKRLIDAQLSQLKGTHPGVRVDYLILSGGLGGSEHLLNYLKSVYIHNMRGQESQRNIQNIISSEDPQLGVVKGVVINSIARIKTKAPIVGSRSCRASYGVVVDQIYNSQNPAHKRAETLVNPTSKVKYARRQISWLITKGKPITPETEISTLCHRVVLEKETNRQWKSIIVISHNDVRKLPQSMDEGGAQVLCEVESNFTDVPLDQFREKNKRWYKSKKHHFVAEYKIVVKLGPADVSFEIVHNGHVMSKENSIDVQWGEAASVPAPGLIEEYANVSTDILSRGGIKRGW